MSDNGNKWQVVVEPDGRTRQIPVGTSESAGNRPPLGERPRPDVYISPPTGDTRGAVPSERLNARTPQHRIGRENTERRKPETGISVCPDSSFIPHPSSFERGFRLALIAANQRARAARQEVEFLREQVTFLNSQMDAGRQAERELRMLFATTSRPALEAAVRPSPATSDTRPWGWAAWTAVLTPTLASAGALAWLALNNWRW